MGGKGWTLRIREDFDGQRSPAFLIDPGLEPMHALIKQAFLRHLNGNPQLTRHNPLREKKKNGCVCNGSCNNPHDVPHQANKNQLDIDSVGDAAEEEKDLFL